MKTCITVVSRQIQKISNTGSKIIWSVDLVHYVLMPKSFLCKELMLTSSLALGNKKREIALAHLDLHLGTEQ